MKITIIGASGKTGTIEWEEAEALASRDHTISPLLFGLIEVGVCAFKHVRELVAWLWCVRHDADADSDIIGSRRFFMLAV